jgi:hypothetical protein
MYDYTDEKHFKRKTFAIALDEILINISEHKASVEQLITFGAVAEEYETTWRNTQLEPIVNEVFSVIRGIILLPDSKDAPVDSYDAFAMVCATPHFESLSLVEPKKKATEAREHILNALVDSVKTMEKEELIKYAQMYWRDRYGKLSDIELKTEYEGIFGSDCCHVLNESFQCYKCGEQQEAPKGHRE